MDTFIERAKNIAVMIIAWGIIIAGGFSLWGCAFVNWVDPWIHRNDNAVAEAPSIGKAEYEIFIKANRRTLYSDDVKESGSVVTLAGFYDIQGDSYTYNKAELVLDRKDFGVIEVKKR